ncbi:hypothetical protein [Bifidobacterium vespertilionis]|uniref:Uncharacterized protein n=1 Tax=Bifidobacterium vespertilionis TaxID=2562524 RepID=A0A5J5DS72_9BIFI|nr:hypothetical protein [Bifidobacterium vespertilionis]KAA8815727.1 hypothetical protein EMO90_11845 [Bifidobacterium vespertilionis]KAA8821029.1 hypothetical protein EM848_11605 [Bifidobacterium vespertilionis]
MPDARADASPFGFGERDRELLELFGLAERQVADDADRMESETASHGIVGPIHVGSHMPGLGDGPLAGAWPSA